MYHEKFADLQKGICGITLNIHWAEPRDPENIEDIKASERYLQFNFGWFAHPILKDGKYPSEMREKIDDKSKKQGIYTKYFFLPRGNASFLYKI